ncbi:MAG: phosphoribosyl-AMP cyclohydrolase [Candidatus Altiarchaeota archaeon]
MLWDELKKRSIDGIEDLIVVIVQDNESNEVLMQAYADREAFEKTVETGKAHYYSTSRKKLWLKGESSGNIQAVREVLVDCDGDTVIYRVVQKGGACHKGYRSCFYRKAVQGGLKVVGEKVFNPDEVYKKG